MREVDPRITRTRERVLGAVRELLSEGAVEAVTYSSIAVRSGVNRSTIYRHWPDRTELLVEAMADVASPDPDPAITDPRSRVFERLRRLRNEMEGDAASALMIFVIHSEHDPAFDKLRQAVIEPLLDGLAFDLEASGHPCPRLTADAYVGALIARRFLRVTTTDDDTLRRILQI